MNQLIKWLSVVVILIVMAFFNPSFANTPEWIVAKTKGRVDYQTALNIVSSVNQHAFKQEIDPDIVFKIITIESNFNKKAISNKNARGLMQVMPRYHGPRYRGENIHDIDTNIRVGIEILAEYKDSKYCLGDITCALRRYYGDLTSNRYARLVKSVEFPKPQPLIFDPLENKEYQNTNEIYAKYLDYDNIADH